MSKDSKVMECQVVCVHMCCASCQKVEQDKQQPSIAYRKSCTVLADLCCSISSKTVLLGLSIFWYGRERSVHGRPSWEFAPYDRESERPKNFTIWCKDVSTQCCVNERAGECGVVCFTSQFFLLEKPKSLPIKTGSQTAWEAVRNNFIEKKDNIASKDYELHGRCAFLFCLITYHSNHCCYFEFFLEVAMVVPSVHSNCDNCT